MSQSSSPVSVAPCITAEELKIAITGLQSVVSDLAVKIIDALKDPANSLMIKSFEERLISALKSGDMHFKTEFDNRSLGDLVRQFFTVGVQQLKDPAVNEEAQKFITEIVRVSINDAIGQITDQIAVDTVKVGVAAAVGVAAILGVVYGYQILQHAIGRPKLIIRERQISWLSPIYDACSEKIGALWKKTSGKQVLIDPIFNEELHRKVNEFSSWIKNIHRNGGYFQNLILYGPGGVGKTMICEKIAEDANINFVMMSGGDLAQYIKRGEHVTELNKLFEKINASSLPTVLFIDECESLCRNRAKIHAPEHFELLNAFLHQTGTPSKKLILCMATNRIEDIDPAVLSRMDYKLYIEPPALPERVKMLKAYAVKFFTKKDQALFTDGRIEAMAGQLEGATGRDIFKLLNKMDAKKSMTLKNAMTAEIIEQTITDWIVEKNTLAQRRAPRENSITLHSL